MVLVKAKRDEILGPLSAVSGIIERRHTLPILSNVLIERSGGKLSFLATDIEIQITAGSGLEAAAESPSITVGARKLLDILRALPDSVEVMLQQQDKKLVVKAGRSRFSLQSLPAEDFPRLAKPSGEAARFKLEQRALRRLLSLVQYAMAQQDIRYYLNGLLMVVEDRSLKLVATDGHRLALTTLKLAAELPRQEVIVPRKTVLELSKLLADSENAADLVGQGPSQDNDLTSILFDLKQNEVIRQSSLLAENVLDHIVERGQLENRGVKQAPFAVLKSPVVPSILVETAFINHPTEAKLLRDPNFQTELANQIALGVLDYLKTAPRISRDGNVGPSGTDQGGLTSGQSRR